MDELKTCSCGNGFYEDTVVQDLVYVGLDPDEYDGTCCFDCAYYEMTGRDYDPYDSNGVPDGCRECGGDYPNCRSSCSLYDE